MDIAKLSMNMAMMNTQTQVGVEVLENAIDMGESLASGMVEMIDAAAMEASVNPELGRNVDIRI